MTWELANKLLDFLKVACPVDTGQLKASIQMVQLDEQHWVITIGSDDAILRDVPSNKYAAFTNNAKMITFRGRTFPNPNYHWANTAIEKWAKENALNLKLEMEDSEDYE